MGDTTIIIKDDDGKPLYKIEPYPNHLCWQVFEWGMTTKRKTKEKVEEWKPLECYPTDLYYACVKLREMMTMRGEKIPQGLIETQKTITRCNNRIVKALKEV